MILKEANHPFLNLRLTTYRKSFKILVSLFILVVYSGLLFLVGAIAQKEHWISAVKQSISDKAITPIDYFKGLMAQPDQLILDIKHKNFQRLRYTRDQALERNMLVVGPDDFVPATLRYFDKTIKIKMRLKGDTVEHFQGNQWSFRIKVKGEETLLGMKQFSIQHPKTRHYIYEWLFHQAAKREGLPALRYHFVDVIINGDNWGLYALEEHFEKRLIEHNQRREGPIVKFDESAWWAERLQFYWWSTRRGDHARELPGVGSIFSLPIDSFQTNKTLNHPGLSENYLVAQHVLEQFRRGELSASDVFEVKSFAEYIALCDLFGASYHPLHTNQFRFYYNPVISRLEPIPFDINGGGKLIKLSGTYTKEDYGQFSAGGRALFLSQLFEDKTFWANYLPALERFSDPDYLETLLSDLDEPLTHNLNLIYGEYRFRFKRDVLSKNQAYIQKILNPVKGLQAYYAGIDDNQMTLQLGNRQALPIELLSVYSPEYTFQPTQSLILQGKPLKQFVDYQDFQFKLPDGFDASKFSLADLKVEYQLLGHSRVRQEAVYPWPYLETEVMNTDVIRMPSNIEQFEFIVTEEATQKIYLKSGDWILDESLIIPKGYRVIANGGVTLNLTQAAKIISYSPLEWIGTEAQPIVIESIDGTGQGIVILKTAEASILEHVQFKNLSHPAQGGWALTGAVTFYEAPVVFNHCQFRGSRSEDALNIIRSQFTITDTLFVQNVSDALDADFAEGEIHNSAFVKTGNDAIDVSGSKVTLQQIFINQAGDKGLSVGEHSQIKATDLKINKTHVAVASKDESRLKINQIQIHESEIGLAVFQKKSEFGPASIIVSGLKSNQVKTPYLVATESRLIVDKKAIAASYSHNEVNEAVYQ